MIKRITPFVIAPIPFILVLVGLCIYVIVTPEEFIDGRPDNAPDRASILLLMFIPTILYPAMLASVSIQSWVMRLIKNTRVSGCILVGTVTSIPISLLFGKIFCAPEFGESLIKATLYSFGVCSITACGMLLIVIGIKKINCQPEHRAYRDNAR